MEITAPATQHGKRGGVFTAGPPGKSLGSTHKFKLDRFVSSTGPEGGGEEEGRRKGTRAGLRTPPLRTESPLVLCVRDLHASCAVHPSRSLVILEAKRLKSEAADSLVPG